MTVVIRTSAHPAAAADSPGQHEFDSMVARIAQRVIDRRSADAEPDDETDALIDACYAYREERA